ncbi:hypothetical protein HIC20_01475 [Buchnera aphidicola (Hormaphis cornu)]|nr:hypothetical protein HIC20_01475 [Buchnera aphidicola (Hormaphis cornu)]
MKVQWYPWLTQHYLKIIHQYAQKTLHHAIMIQSPPGMGVNSLVWQFSCWMLCLNPNKFKKCNICHSCLLMQSYNHPDWYSISLENNTKKNRFK